MKIQRAWDRIQSQFQSFYAAEAIVGGVHGSNRLGDHSLLDYRFVAWSSKQFGEVSCSLDNDELAEACEASLLQSIEEEQLRLSQVPRSDAGYASRVTSAMHAKSSNGDDPFAKVKSLISEMIAKQLVPVTFWATE